MDEYITRNNAISAACFGCNQEFSDEPCEPNECAIRQSIMALPAADVVPRAEVDHARLRGYENGIRSGARGVFKEMNELIKDYVNNHLDTAVLVVKLYLLEKKYTGEQK